MSLIDKIRKAREVTIDADGHTFTIRRPTDEEALALRGDEITLVSIVKRFTIGWNLQEIDLIPGGVPVAVPFDYDLFSEWVADRPEVWEPLGNGILDAYRAHSEKRSEAAKN